MIPLHELRRPGVALDWHEAVAVVAALSAGVREAQLAHAPAFDAAALALDGEVGVVSDAVHEGPPVLGAAAVLERLLESRPCPAELMQLARNYQVADETASPGALEEFLLELAFFERPGREDLLRHLAERALVAVERSRAAGELDRLTERARHQPENPPRSTPPRMAAVAESVSHVARRLAVPAAVAGVVSLAIAFGAATLLTTAEAPERAAPVSADPADEEVAPEPAAERGAPAPPNGAGPPHSGAASSAGAQGTELGRGPSTPAGTRVPAARAATPAGGFDVRVKELGGAALPAHAGGSTAAVPERPRGVVYALGDRGVEPAILVRPHLPAEPPPDVPPEAVGTLELIVSETGAVEHVHLISPSNRFQERMLVAAAKAWVFSPALKDGRPVRFRARIKVTL